MEYEITITETFDKWLRKLRDRRAVLAISSRINRAQLGNFGDSEPVGSGISEMRIFIGKGYRIYFTVKDGQIIILLCGGDKSTQQKDIKKAKELAQKL